jgi:hypothetical protein
MRYLQIKPNLVLVEQPVAVNQNAPRRATGINHIWIYDRSGSMYGVLPQLAKDLCEKVRSLPVGDTLTLGWFSSEGERNFMVKGYKITGPEDHQKLADVINKNKHTLGTTCFSEILNDTDQVLKDLSVFSSEFALCFFTDGYPVVSNYSREIESIHGAIKKIAGRIASSLLVGYSNYYNKELMSEMAAKLGGALIHSESLMAFSRELTSFMDQARENGAKQIVEISAPLSKGSVVFGVNGRQVAVYEPSDKNEVAFVPSEPNASIFVLTNKAPKGATEVTISENELQRPTGKEPMIRAAYAASYLLTQRTKSDVALEVLATLGDRALIDSVSNAFTNTEYGRAEAQILDAMTEPKKGRLTQGYAKNYLPPEDAFCLLDVLRILMADEEAFFYPQHDAFDYKRIGVGAKTKDGYPKFEADPQAKCSLSKLTWNKSMLNLSLQCQIRGTVELQGEYAKHGFTSTYPTYVYRNYALVKDGFLNVQKLPVSLSEDAFELLQANGVIDRKLGYLAGNVYVLSLDAVPVINRAIANGKTSATELCKKAYKELELEAQLKVLNFYKNQLDPDGKANLGKGALTADQELYLQSQGIGRNGFSPPTEKVEATDFYMAKEFEIKIKGHSSLPKVDEVIEKAKKGGKLTPTGQLIKSGVDLYQSNCLAKSEKATLSAIDDKIGELKRELVKVRSDIQETKFAIILGKKWFDEFSSRDKSTLDLNGVEYNLAIEETKVEV